MNATDEQELLALLSKIGGIQRQQLGYLKAVVLWLGLISLLLLYGLLRN